MQKTPCDPVNHVVTKEDLDGNFSEFLNRITDVPASESLHPIHINEAGITNQQAYIQIEDIEGNETVKTVLCNIEIGVDLSGHRGIHMSRCEEVLFALSQRTFASLDDFALTLAREVQKTQKSPGCAVKVTGLYLHDHKTKKTEKISQDKIFLLSEVVTNQELVQQKTGVRAYNINACPCTRAYTKFSAIPALQEAGFDRDQINKILEIVVTGSHTQRGTISVIIDKTSEQITSGEIFRIIDESVHLVYELLKRPDEHELVTRALQKPQFTEDVVREVVLNAFKRYGNTVPETTMIIVESILQDSIHIHDVRTKVQTTLKDIRKALTHEEM